MHSQCKASLQQDWPLNVKHFCVLHRLAAQLELLVLIKRVELILSP
jgi:hypothetical protein